MTDNGATSRGLPPHAQLIQMGTASWVSGIVYTGSEILASPIAWPKHRGVPPTGRDNAYARAVAASPPACAGRPGHPHRARRAALRADVSGRSAQDGRPGLGARDVDGVLRPGVLARLKDRLFAGNGKDGI